MPTSKAKTIDRYDVATSRRYAADQKFLEEEKDFLKSVKTLGGIATVSVTSPYPSSDFEELFNTAKNQSWAHFKSPQNFNAKSIFSYQLIPSLGNYNELENLRDKMKRKRKKKKGDSILSLINCVLELTKNHEYIRDRREQYHKG